MKLHVAIENKRYFCKSEGAIIWRGIAEETD